MGGRQPPVTHEHAALDRGGRDRVAPGHGGLLGARRVAEFESERDALAEWHATRVDRERRPPDRRLTVTGPPGTHDAPRPPRFRSVELGYPNSVPDQVELQARDVHVAYGRVVVVH